MRVVREERFIKVAELFLFVRIVFLGFLVVEAVEDVLDLLFLHTTSVVTVFLNMMETIRDAVPGRCTAQVVFESSLS